MQVNKELKDAMTQLDSIRYEVQNLSRFTPGQFMRQHNPGKYDYFLSCFHPIYSNCCFASTLFELFD